LIYLIQQFYFIRNFQLEKIIIFFLGCLACLFFLMMLIIVLNYTSPDVIKENKQMSLTIYFVVVFLLIFGLLLSKKNSYKQNEIFVYFIFK
jgi:hypothetical protein